MLQSWEKKKKEEKGRKREKKGEKGIKKDKKEEKLINGEKKVGKNENFFKMNGGKFFKINGTIYIPPGFRSCELTMI